ncbi:MAG: helix-turn-helix domain-containing protein, partial [Atopostipes suicloacalis]|nr:helix-turn-helix domain-containing protein [Atopostipes suicloacalis]
KNPYHQEKIRQLFRQAKGSLMLSQWIDEQLFVFNHLETKKADILANLLTGHKKNGRTRKQIAEHLGMSAYEFNFYLRDMIQEIIEIVRENELTIMASVLKQTEEENFFSMSKSTYESYKMFKKGKVIPEIASDREIKENTVKEHLLEIAFIIKRFPINKFVPENIHSYLTKEFIENENYIYKDIPAEKEIEFYHYRLVEIERMRRT